MNSQLIKVEAVKGGFAEGIALDSQGYVSEGSGENLFVVSKGRLITPPLVSSVLPGITRDSVLALARRLGIPVEEKALPREMREVCKPFAAGAGGEGRLDRPAADRGASRVRSPRSPCQRDSATAGGRRLGPLRAGARHHGRGDRPGDRRGERGRTVVGRASAPHPGTGRHDGGVHADGFGKANSRGRLVIECADLEDLRRIVDLIDRG
jgi:hypothetical protein